jgi:3-dehydroshikimate dehydratase
MFIPGLVSITFRELSATQIVELCVESGLKAVEWGGDVHVPHGNISAATSVRRITEDAGLAVEAYGSYYHAAASEDEGLSFDSVAETALALGAPLVRVWAGKQGSEECGDGRSAVVDDIKRIAEIAKSRNLRVGLEFHGGTLTDTNESAMRLLKEVDDPNVLPYWQPPNDKSIDCALEGLKSMADVVYGLHVFHWDYSSGHRDVRSLSDGVATWTQYLRAVAFRPDVVWAMMEFVKDGDEDQFRADAQALLAMITDLEARGE